MNKTDISVSRNPVNGSYEVSAIINGYREHQVYYGYTKREAIAIFRQKFGI